MSAEPLVKINKLSIRSGEKTLVRDLNLALMPGKTLAIVGESGSGKSLSSLALMGLLPPSLQLEASILFEGQELVGLGEEAWTKIRGAEIAMIFQEPMSALNPSMTCGKQVAEMLQLHQKWSAKEIKGEVIRLFTEVELPRVEQIYEAYPHQLSGGQKQRVMIAMAIANKPKLLIADEPTTALDVSVQAEILKLLSQLQKEHEMAMIFISHDLALVKDIADEVLVMFQGETKEYGIANQVFNEPQDPYTKGLLACRPQSSKPYRRLPLVKDFLSEEASKLELLKEDERIQNAKALIEGEALFEVKDLSKYYRQKAGILGKAELITGLQDFALKIYPGESLGLVGESGSGKSTFGRLLVGLEKPASGSILYRSKDISKAPASEWRRLHKEIQIIFQDPFASLNPRLKIGEALVEVLKQNTKLSNSEALLEAQELLEKVGLKKDQFGRYPHEFSGGQRQRIGIARALALKPKFIVCDESVSALDVSVQAQILNLLNDLKEEFGFTYLFISHDLQVVNYFCDRVIVMQKGQLVEIGISDELYKNPQTDYTKMLIEAAPD